MFLVVHIHPIWIQRPLSLNLTPILHFLQCLLLCPHLLSYILDQYKPCLLQELTWGLDLGRQIYARVFTKRPWVHKARVFMAAQRGPAITSTCGDFSAGNSLETDLLVVRPPREEICSSPLEWGAADCGSSSDPCPLLKFKTVEVWYKL